MDGQFDPFKVYEMLAKIISAREGVEIRVVQVVISTPTALPGSDANGQQNDNNKNTSKV